MAIVGVAILSSVFTLNFSSNSDGVPSAADSSFAMGHVTAYLVGEDGNVKAYRQTDNVIVNTGLDIIANQVFGNGTVTNSTLNIGPAYSTSGGTVKAVAVGTGGGGTPMPGQADLETYNTNCANKTTSWTEGKDVSGDNMTSVVVTSNTTFNGADNCDLTINEVGLFTDVTGTQDGRMFALQEFGDVTVGSSDTLTINWDITFADN